MTRIVQCLLLLLASNAIGGKSFQTDLRKLLLNNYDPMALPQQQNEVGISFTIIDYNINQIEQTLDLDIWMKFSWEDSQLKWDARKYPHIKKLTFDPTSVWRPDFYLYNNADHENFEVFASTKVLSMNDNGMLWVPPAHVKAMCVVDLTYWPYDSQLCEAKFGSWVHHTQEVMLYHRNNTITFEDTTEFSQNTNDVSRRGWTITENYTRISAKKYACCEEDYQSVSIFMRFHRNESAYSWIVGVPCIMICFISFLVFLLPLASSEKIFLSTIVFLANLLFLMSLSKTIGHTPHNTPLIVKMVSGQLIVIGIHLFVSITIIRLTRSPFGYGLPNFVANIAESFGSSMGLSGYVKLAQKEKESSNEKKPSKENTCLLVGAFIDRICLIIFIFIFLIFLIRFPLFS